MTTSGYPWHSSSSSDYEYSYGYDCSYYADPSANENSVIERYK